MNAQKPVSLNMNVRGQGLSATLEINQKCRELRAAGRPVFNMGLGQSPFPVPDSVVQALRDAAAEKDYLPVHGLPALREAVAAFHRGVTGLGAQADGVIIGPGSKELMFLLQLAYYGEITITTPCWVSYVPQARIIGRKVNMIATRRENNWKVTPDELRHAFEIVQDDYRPRLLVLNYPSNPTGMSHSAAELREIADVVRRYGVIVLSDEIYGELDHQGRHTSIAQYYPEATIVSSGLSKWCGAGGWRLGTFFFPPDLYWLRDALAAVASETYTSVCAPIQYAAVRAFQLGADIETYLAHARRILAALGGRCAEPLNEAGLHVPKPDGAFYLYADFTPHQAALNSAGVQTGQALCSELLEKTGVAVLPASSFARSRAELAARLAYIDFDGAAALHASTEIGLDQPLPNDFCEQHCARVLQAAERISEWTTTKIKANASSLSMP